MSFADFILLDFSRLQRSTNGIDKSCSRWNVKNNYKLTNNTNIILFEDSLIVIREVILCSPCNFHPLYPGITDKIYLNRRGSKNSHEWVEMINSLRR